MRKISTLFLIAINIFFTVSIYAADNREAEVALPMVLLQGVKDTMVNNKGYITEVYAKGPTGASGVAYLLCSTDTRENLFGLQSLTGQKAEINDVTFQYYSPRDISVDIDSLITQPLADRKKSLLQANKLDLSNHDLTPFNFLWGPELDLSCIRTIDISCSSENKEKFDANNFLTNLLMHCKTLRSLEFIYIENTNVSLATVDIWRNSTEFLGPLIRENEEINSTSGWKVAFLYIHGVRTTPIMTVANITDRRNLQRSSQRKLSVLYRGKNERGEAHIQVVLK
jgi:hypothetical protein